MIYVFDLDNTLCIITKNKQGHIDYNHAMPMLDRISKINKLYDEGHLIKIDSARGSESGIDWTELTKHQLNSWGLKYHLLRVGKKMSGDFYIDDKSITDIEFFK